MITIMMIRFAWRLILLLPGLIILIMADDDLSFDFERSFEALPAPTPQLLENGQEAPPVQLSTSGHYQLALSHEQTHDLSNVRIEHQIIGLQQPGNFKRNFRKTVCSFWLRDLCMKGDSCGFLHQFDSDKMPVCRNLLQYGECKETDCPYKHDTDDISDCNMFKLGFCIYGPKCRYKHRRLPGPPPDPKEVEAAKPREHRNLSLILGFDDPPPYKTRQGQGQAFLQLTGPQQGAQGQGVSPMGDGSFKRPRPTYRGRDGDGPAWGEGQGQGQGGPQGMAPPPPPPSSSSRGGQPQMGGAGFPSRPPPYQ